MTKTKNKKTSKTLDITKRYVNIKELSLYTSLPIKTLYEWASIGKIPSIKYGRRVLFDLQDIDKIMLSLKRPQRKLENKTNKIIGEFKEKIYNTPDSCHADTIRHVKGGG